MIAVNSASGIIVASDVRSATTMWGRFRGLMGRRGLADGEAVLIDPCNSIHTCFMRFSIDAIFLDKDDRVLKVAGALRPFRFVIGRGARRVLEAAAGTAARAGVKVGDRLQFQDSR